MNLLSIIPLGMALALSTAHGPATAADEGIDPLTRDFLDQPILGTQRILVYRVRYQNSPAPLPLTYLTTAVSETEFAWRVESILEGNAYGAMDVEIVIASGGGAGLLLPRPMSGYVDTCGDLGAPGLDYLRVLQDARTVAGNHPLGPWDWEEFDYEVVVADRWDTTNPCGNSMGLRAAYCHGPTHLVGQVVHELGHTFKFRHASYWEEDPRCFSSPCDFGWTGEEGEEYGDRFDPMGGATCETPDQHFNPRHKVWANWMDVPTVTADGSTTISKIETPGGPLPNAIRIARDEEWSYYVFYRGDDPAASSACYGTPPTCNGAMITRSRDTNLYQDGGNEGNTLLLNANPFSPFGAGSSCLAPILCANPTSLCSLSSTNWCNAVLPEGESFFDPGGGAPTPIEITVTDVSPDTITVDVDFGGANPAITAQPPINLQPILDVVAPAQGAILSGTIDFQVWGFDPSPDEAITTFVLGIDRDNGSYEHSVTFAPPPLPPAEQVVTWSFDTLANLLPDGTHAFYVEAHTGNSAVPRILRFDFFLDNGICP